MKSKFTSTLSKLSLKLFAVVSIVFLIDYTSFAQTRIYVINQTNGNSGLCAGCTVTDPDNAISTNHSDFARLNIISGLLVAPSIYQTLIFPATNKPAAGTPVEVKIGTGNQLSNVGLLGAISTQA